MNFIEQRISQLEHQLNDPECNNPLKVEHKLEAYKEIQWQVKNCSIPDVVGRSEQLRAFKQFLQSEYHLPVSYRMVDEFEQEHSLV